MGEFQIDIVDNRTFGSYSVVYTELLNSSPSFITTLYNESGGRNLSRYDMISKRDPLYILIPITVIYSVILLTGLVGNVSTCVVIARNKHMHTATNYYLFSLAVSDLLLLVSGLPQEMYYIWWRGHPEVLGEAVCIIQGFAAETSANATVLTITAFTVERYVAICRPFQSHTFSKLSRAVRLVVVIWLVALGLAVPQAIQFGVLKRKSEDGTDFTLCTVTSEQVQHAFEISTLVFFVAPMTLITVLYILIGLKLRRSKLLHAAKRASTGSSGAERGNDRSTASKSGSPQNYVIRMLVAVVVAFFICWAPFHAQRLLAVYARSNQSDSPLLLTVYKTLTYTSGVLYYLSTTVNPVLYHIMSHKFREAFKSTLVEPCGCNRKTSNKIRTYSVLHYQQSSRHTSLQQQQQQQVQRQSQRSRNKTDDKALPTLPSSAERHKSKTNQSVQHLLPQNCSDYEEVKLTQIECIPVALSADTVPCSSYEMYAYRPRGFSNSSQTTLTTSLGKLSLNEGSYCRRSESNVAAAGDAKTSNGNCGKHSTLDDMIPKGGDGTSSTRNSTRQKQDDIGPRSRKGMVAFTSKFKSAPRAAAIGVLARKLRALPLAGSTKHDFTPQQEERGNEDIPEGSTKKLSSHVSIDSAKSTISNSSLKDLDGAEFVGSELAHYMGELNEQRMVR